MPSSQNHIDPHALDSILHHTLQLHRSCAYKSADSSMPALTPGSLDQQQQQQQQRRHQQQNDHNNNSPIYPARSPSQWHRRRAHSVAKDLKLSGFFTSSSSSLSSNQAEEGMESPLTSSSMVTSPTQSSASRLPSFESVSFRPIAPAQLLLAPPSLLSPPTSPASSISPTSPLKIAFSSPHNHRNDPTNCSTTFASFHNQLSPGSKQSYIAHRQMLQDGQIESKEQLRCLEGDREQPTLFRSRSHSQPSTPTTPSDPSRFSISSRHQFTEPPQHTHQSHGPSSPPPPPRPRRVRVSTGSSCRTNNTFTHTASYAPARQHHLYSTLLDSGNANVNHRASQQAYTSPSYQSRSYIPHDSKEETPMIIPIHVRYVPKDLWVQVDLPRDMPVHKARDLILSKCRLTSIPLQISATSSALTTSDLPSDNNPDTTPSQQRGLRTRDPSHFYVDSAWHQQENSSSLTIHCDGASLHARNHRSGHSGQDDDSFNDQESIDDDEAELRAEELMGSDMFGQSSSARSGAAGVGRTDSINQGLQGLSFTSSRVRNDNHGYQSSGRGHAQPPLSTRPIVKQDHQHRHHNQSQQQHALTQQQLKQLISYSTLHKNDGHGSTISSDRHGKDGHSAKRFSNIPGWANYRSRQISNNSKHIDREVLNHGGMLADHCLEEENLAITEEHKSECTAWKACFGLFWLAAGHWLDDSRLVSSYNLQPHCLLELQLKNNYIQLPPPGTPLNYYDHYAEGLLYKKSKKNKLGQGNRECTGVWKERWVVLQGTKLYIYHKRKDTTKKSQELTPPLTVVATIIPQNARHSFRLTSSSMAMSSSMISIFTSQDPTVPVVCFRASSESELNHWIRIFNSLNNTTLQGMAPPFDLNVTASSIVVPPPLPPLPSMPPPASMDRTTISTTKRHRHHSHTATYHRNIIEGAYHSERKRSHTSQSTSGTPSINPVLISNAAAALSNLHHGTGGSSSNSDGESEDGEERRANYTIAELKYRHSRSSYSSTGFGYKNLHQLERQALSRNSSLSSYRNSTQNKPGGLARQRTLTEPGYLSRMRSIISQRSSQQMLRDQLRRSNGSVPEPLAEALTVAEQATKTLGDISLLEPSVQALLKAAGTVLYSGHIWLYIPHDDGTSKKYLQDSLDTSPDSRRPFFAPSMSRTSSTSSVPTGTQGTRAANICITKASGRYVKCFAVINDQGHFQWTEVRKQDDGDGGDQVERPGESLAPNPRFGFPLTSTRGRERGFTVESDSDEDADLSNNISGFKPERTVQASMAHKLRLYFFCIRISTSSVGDITVEFMESPSALSRRSSSPGSPPALTKKSPLREKNRLSALPRTRTASSPLPPLPTDSSTTKSHARSGSMVPSFGRFTHLNPPVWPSMSPLHERPLPPTPMPTPPPPEMLAIPKVVWAPASAQMPLDKSLLTRTPSLFVENRSRSAPPGSIFPTAASLTRTSSYSGLLRNIILAASADITPEQVRPKHHSYSQAGTPDRIMMTPESAPPTVVMSPSSASNVLSLAEDLQKALQTRQEPSDNINNGNSLGLLGSPLLSSSMRATKPTLSEITSQKRASIQQQQEALSTALNVERSRLKLIGVLNTLEEGCEVEDGASTPLAKGTQDKLMKQEASQIAAAALARVLLQCPFLEQSEAKDADGRTFVSLKGYTETEAAWKALQKTLESFLDGPIKDQRSALPPEDTLIPSYHAPRAPEIRLSEKAQNFLRAKDRVNAAAAAAVAAAATATMTTALAGVEEGSTFVALSTNNSLHQPSITTQPTMKAMLTITTLPSLTPSLTRSGSFSQHAAPEGLLGHPLLLTNGTGYGPRKSFGVLDIPRPNDCTSVVAGATPV